MPDKVTDEERAKALGSGLAANAARAKMNRRAQLDAAEAEAVGEVPEPATAASAPVRKTPDQARKTRTLIDLLRGR